MDEHDRVLVGSVARGDKLLAVDDVMVATMAPGEVQIQVEYFAAFLRCIALTSRLGAPTEISDGPAYLRPIWIHFYPRLWKGLRRLVHTGPRGS